jgi:hypothetical protein
MKLQHSFFKNYPDTIKLISGTSKFGTVTSRINRIADDITNRIPVNFTSSKTVPLDIANDFRGAAFEAFGEIFIKLLGIHPQVGIEQYEPMTGDDYGIDGKGIGNNGKILTVQFKFRSEFDSIIYGDKDHLHNFINASLEMGVDIKDNMNMVIITTASEVFYKDMSVSWKDRVRYISGNASWGCFKGQKYVPQNPTNILSLKTLLDDNKIFWNSACQLVKNQ